MNQHESFAPVAAGHSNTAADALRSDFFQATLARALPDAPAVTAAAEMPAPVQQAIQQGSAIHFTSAGENQAANRQPDYYLNTDGQLVHNANAQPSLDGSINIQLQTSSQDQQDNKSLRDAILHENDMQKQAAKEMIRLYQKDHPGQPVPGWMNDLASARPNLPDFVPYMPAQNQQAAPAPENGFVPRGVSGSGDGGGGGFAGNGGFDGGGMFHGNGGAGDGSLNTGAYDGSGQPLGPGETVQAKQIYDYLTDHYHLSPVAASGILGNMQVESSLRTNAHNSAEGAIGLCQWEGPRRTELEHFASSEGKPVTDWHVQVDFMMKELQGNESGAFSRLQSAQSPQQAAAVFDQFYERSSGAARGTRMANAENIYQQVASAPSDKRAVA